uniref:Uncharacterized protein n=1 Tax=Meloidogyne enterolobii TaxID=390850 RepID=A0A6V7WGT6_MELEN|nr:unnamed protein product [Meloidogyne enterolobii]
MTESSSNYASEVELSKQIDDLIKQHSGFKHLQIKFNEENEKCVNLEKKNSLLENELKETDKKIDKIKLDYENEIKELKQNIQQLKSENGQKDEKINSLEEKIKKANDLSEKKFVDLTIKLNNSVFEYVDFVKIKNKWGEIDGGWNCCGNKCVNNNTPIGNCISGNGFVNLINDENIKYINRLEGKGYDKCPVIYAENSFIKLQCCLNYSLYYFEIKCIMERENSNVNWVTIGLKSCITNKWIRFLVKESSISNEKDEKFKIDQFTWNNNDIFGCGLVYPPTNKMSKEMPYVFFTQNGKLIGKGISLKENFDSFKPRVSMICCSVETNFGSDLNTKPFKYDILKHLILKEFY